MLNDNSPSDRLHYTRTEHARAASSCTIAMVNIFADVFGVHSKGGSGKERAVLDTSTDESHRSLERNDSPSDFSFKWLITGRNQSNVHLHLYLQAFDFCTGKKVIRDVMYFVVNRFCFVNQLHLERRLGQKVISQLHSPLSKSWGLLGLHELSTIVLLFHAC